MDQPTLFDVPAVERIRNPLCLYQTPCKVTATLGPRVVWDDGYNQSITCDKCKRCIGERSTSVA